MWFKIKLWLNGNTWKNDMLGDIIMLYQENKELQQRIEALSHSIINIYKILNSHGFTDES